MTFPDLDAIIASAELEELPALAGRCHAAALRAELRLRGTATPQRDEPAASPDKPLTIAQTADLMGCSENYVETLVRQHKLPVVYLPGTNKAGQERDGRQRRILLSSLLEQLKALERAPTEGAPLKLVRTKGGR